MRQSVCGETMPMAANLSMQPTGQSTMSANEYCSLTRPFLEVAQ
jgi:hypothetical protein